MPSKIVKFFKFDTVCFVGKNDLSYKKLLQPGKAGSNQNIGFKSSVRGVAKNPVDHPNGGRTKSCSPEKSP
jgi:large subunit ribosomal protein L2